MSTQNDHISDFETLRFQVIQGVSDAQKRLIDARDRENNVIRQFNQEFDSLKIKTEKLCYEQVILKGMIQDTIDKKDIKNRERQNVIFKTKRELERVTKKMISKQEQYEAMLAEVEALKKASEETEAKSTIKRTITSVC